jgi:hypothetical protein
MTVLLEDVANGVAEAHITPHGGIMIFNKIDGPLGIYSAVISHNGKTIEETINIFGMPGIIAEEYVHCRVHSLAAKLLRKIYPLNPLDIR